MSLAGQTNVETSSGTDEKVCEAARDERNDADRLINLGGSDAAKHKMTLLEMSPFNWYWGHPQRIQHVTEVQLGFERTERTWVLEDDHAVDCCSQHGKKFECWVLEHEESFRVFFEALH